MSYVSGEGVNFMFLATIRMWGGGRVVEYTVYKIHIII
jgi:hypothetical protein